MLLADRVTKPLYLFRKFGDQMRMKRYLKAIGKNVHSQHSGNDSDIIADGQH